MQWRSQWEVVHVCKQISTYDVKRLRAKRLINEQYKIEMEQPTSSNMQKVETFLRLLVRGSKQRKRHEWKNETAMLLDQRVIISNLTCWHKPFSNSFQIIKKMMKSDRGWSMGVFESSFHRNCVSSKTIMRLIFEFIRNIHVFTLVRNKGERLKPGKKINQRLNWFQLFRAFISEVKMNN